MQLDSIAARLAAAYPKSNLGTLAVRIARGR